MSVRNEKQIGHAARRLDQLPNILNVYFLRVFEGLLNVADVTLELAFQPVDQLNLFLAALLSQKSPLTCV
jgi:hypothetical protein